MRLNIRTKPQRLLASIFLVSTLALSICLTIVSCSHKTMSADEASKWIAAYTPSHIDKDSKIRIELTDLTRNKVDSTYSLEKVVKFTPSVKGKTVLSHDRRFIDFVPEKSFKQGKEYECKINMKELTGIDSLGYFSFKFFVDNRELTFEKVKSVVDPDNLSMMTITGILEYNVTAGDRITKDSTIILCDYPGAKVKMDNTATNMSRGFKITGIKRENKDRILNLTTNPIGGFSIAEYSVTVPSVSDFKLLDAERIDVAEPYLNLEFSTPLSSQQELDGLITIDKINNLRIERNGTNVKVYYPNNGITDITLRISDLLKNSEDRSLDEEIELHFKQTVIPPAVEIPINGTILPDNGNLKLPFRAVNLAAVDVEVVKIFPSNVMSFLQENDLDGSYELRRFGRLIYHQTVRLDKDKSLNLHQWQDFAIDLKGLFAKDRGAVYNIRLSFRKKYSLYDKSEVEDFEIVELLSDEDNRTWDKHYSYIYRENPDYDWHKMKWNESKDPSKDSYYMVVNMPECNLVASDLGLIVKRADETEVLAAVTNIVTTAPLKDINVTAYNYQLQKIGSAVTDENGFAKFKTTNRPFMVTATDGRSTTYLKIKDGYELSTSNFDVSGKKLTDGIKGFTYGERGVWRPGDEIHLTLIVEDKKKTLPRNHPVVMELYNPLEQLYDRQTVTNGLDGVYVFNISTGEDVPTGVWTAHFKVGNEVFYHPVRIETIKPNRMKINISTPEVIMADKKERIGIEARWLTGPVAKNMPVSMEMTLFTNPTPFAQYKKYTFQNPLVSYSSSKKDLFSGKLDSIGTIHRDCTIGADTNSPGMLQANITAKVTEPGGDASITSRSVPFSPFGVYVGIDLGDKEYMTDTEIQMPIVVVNQIGAKMKTRELDYKIYKLDWNWWWEGSANDLNRYVQSTSADVVSKGTITVSNGVSKIPFKVEYPDWGKYLVIVRDNKGGHATGGVITVDWPEWRGRAGKGNAVASTELSFTLDKKKYEVGETANIYLPKCDGGRVLLSIENGTGVLKRMWVNTSGKTETKYPIYIDKGMAPNFYVSATLLRPHKGTDFDTPIRLFGVQSVAVIDSRSILHPVIDMTDELHPQEQFLIKISERDNKPMTYTLAIVDEGLLDITNFKTPRPWIAMNQKEALGVKTWDMYDDVIGAFGNNFKSILSIGGDEALRRAAGKEKRFNPVVRFIGPFTIKGGSKTHKITLPNYVGSVRVMVVAAHDGCYGNADKTVKVTSPIMLLSTLPRTLACSDTVTVPVNLFAMDDGVKNVVLNIETDGPVKVSGSKNQTVTFSEQGEKMVKFRLLCDNKNTGKARIILTASGNGYVAKDTTYIDVKNPMPNIIETVEKTLQANSTVEFSWHPIEKGLVSLQIASMPSLNFNGIYLFMESYPHLCTEQLSSKALFMLYGRKFLDDENRKICEKELPRIIKAIQSRQLSNGGFVYWPGNSTENDWVTSMAGIVLTEADRQGFRIDDKCLERWKKNQESKSREYKYSINTDLDQAFRLFSLVLANDPQIPAMNRLRESKMLSRSSALCLSSAYFELGRKDVAEKLIERAERTESKESNDWFYSRTRNNAIELQAYALCGNTPKSLSIAREIASACKGSEYVTQDVAFATMAMNQLSKLVGSGTNSVKIIDQNGKILSLHDFADMKDVVLNSLSGTVKVENGGNNTLELSLLKSYQPSPDKVITANAKGIKMSVSYIDMSGHPINVANLKQDTEFRAKITISNLGNKIQNMALTYGIPSGWEIWNERLYGYASTDDDYRDIRDNSYNCYFSLDSGKSKTYEVRLRAAYAGNYLLPPTVCEDMYNPACRAMTSNKRVTVSL